MSAYTLFISDLHLDASHPKALDCLQNLLVTDGQAADAIYILGDLFELWIGDDYHTPFHQQVIKLLAQYTQTGKNVFFIHGNRDFLIGKQFVKQTGIQLLNDPSMINLYGRNILITHGDSLCTADKNHQRFRFLYTKEWLQKMFTCLPIKWRQNIANHLRENSQSQNPKIADYIMDVTNTAVTTIIKNYDVTLLIHGHTHRPAIHYLADLNAKRIVLGSWHRAGSVLKYNDQHEYKLTMLPFVVA